MLHKRAVEAVKNRRRMLMGDVALPDNCKCGGLFEEVGHEWLGEDDKGVGSTKVTQQCEECGHVRQYIIGENGSLKVTRDSTIIGDYNEIYNKEYLDRIKELKKLLSEKDKYQFGSSEIADIKNKIAEYQSLYKRATATPSGDAAGDTTAYKGYLITETLSGEVMIEKEGTIIQHNAGSIESAKKIIDELAGVGDSTGAFETEELEAEDVYTKDPLTEKGKEILAAMKEQYGEEEGEKIFYASKNKGTIEGADSAISKIDELSDDIIIRMLKSFMAAKSTNSEEYKELLAEAAKRNLGMKFLTGDSTPYQTRRVEELSTAIKSQRLAGHTKDAERLEEELGKELEKTAIGEDYRGYKTTDQIYKGFMIYKSGKNPARFTLKNESGITYEGSLEDAKKQVDEYWNRRDEEVVNQKLQGDSRTKDAKNIVSYVSSQIESEKRKLRGKKIVENFGQDIVRKLRDRLNYNELRYGDPEERMAAGLIDAFDDWCSSYTGDQVCSKTKDFNPSIKQRLRNVARKLKNNRLGLGPGGGRRDGSGLAKGGNGMQSAGLGGRKQLQGDAETTIFSQQGYKIVKSKEDTSGDFTVITPGGQRSSHGSLTEAREYIVKLMKENGVYGKFGKDAKAKDGVNHMGEKEYQTYEAWKRACKQANPSVRFEGDKDICNALPNVGEWDGATGVVYNAGAKDANINPFDTHQKRIAIDTIKNPMKGKFLGGPSYAEAKEILMKKFGYTESQIKALEK